ncbi:LD-carboxypeptidase [Tenacibaculum dicentrarchi]|nr:LD-carboxypeptidase [Tenacibaculum dicentrarchi]MCD8414215.1 LD-carboxypeptidase [Tenacibaculum dicentrarchi]MCD8419147.1 LD-carboxypeptidase [Tenacibaculum dicentrarchi]MCD8424159.1 LD-carboxypeptidase [Tenacibaculum dicentrarchi]MCD8434152.1 LD-carboxypeptidase [Tenacibaculum dicentrarchi]
MKQKMLVFSLLLLSVSMNAQNNFMNLITPPSLQKGDTIAIIAPAGILKNRKHIIDKAKKLAQSWGLKVVYGKHMFNQSHHFSGTDEQRCQDFQDALDNPNIKAIWSARGGYGSVRILDKLDFSKFKENPKWVIGYSDITAFHNHIHNLGVETIHGIMGTSLQDKPEVIAKSIVSLKKILFGESLSYKILASKYNKLGSFKGELVGGNIAILASMLGSDSQISTENKVLFIEEIGEYKYSIDRMLQSLKRAGYFTKVSGIIVGDMTKVKKNSTPWGSSIEQLILDVIPKEIPVIFNFPAGHEPDNRALIMGRTVEVNNDKIVTVNFK